MQRVLVAAMAVAVLVACGGTSTSDGGTGGGSGGGGTGGGSGGGAAGGGSGGGATGGGTGGGGTGMPLTINLSYQSQCPAINPQCGGDLVGRWFYTAACVDGSILGDLNSACTGGGATITVTNITGTTRGEVTFTSTNVSRSVNTNLVATLSVPAACAVVGCSTIQAALDALYDSVSCSSAGAGCTCTITHATSISDGAAYTSSNGVISVGGGARAYAYCRTGSSMVYRETSTPMTEPGTLTLEKQ
ncbi:MAG: hypothetical protein IT380_16275 [Myxococcales bacterium]|nr:hypothetical protein [Myxococcales bacterium]